MLRFPKNKYVTFFAVLIVVAAAVGLYLRDSGQDEEAAWFDDDWHYRIRMTIDSSKVDADLANFPVAIHYALRGL